MLAIVSVVIVIVIFIVIVIVIVVVIVVVVVAVFVGDLGSEVWTRGFVQAGPVRFQVHAA